MNLLPKTENIIYHPFHTDNPSKKGTSAIFYINSNNGVTRFDEGYIESVENRLVRFPCTKPHAGSTCTDEHFRVVLNIKKKEKNGNI